MSRTNDLYNNLKRVKERVERAANKSGRDISEITILPVSKTVDVDDVETIMEFGLNEFGENRVQELLRKYEYFEMKNNNITQTDINQIKKPSWHLIGHLQTNKIKYIIDKVKLIHSVDSMKLANEINNQAEKHGIVMPVLLQVNVSGEESKFGVDVEHIFDIVTKMSYLSNIRLKGLMTMAPNVSDPEDVRGVFKGLKALSVDLQVKKIHNIDMSILSMGMSHDFEVAIEEGANIVRIGSSIFN